MSTKSQTSRSHARLARLTVAELRGLNMGEIEKAYLNVCRATNADGMLVNLCRTNTLQSVRDGLYVLTSFKGFDPGVVHMHGIKGEMAYAKNLILLLELLRAHLKEAQ